MIFLEIFRDHFRGRSTLFGGQFGGVWGGKLEQTPGRKPHRTSQPDYLKYLQIVYLTTRVYMHGKKLSYGSAAFRPGSGNFLGFSGKASGKRGKTKKSGV